MSQAQGMSGFVANRLSGLRLSPMEVTDATDRATTGDPEDAICRGFRAMGQGLVDAGRGGGDTGSM